MTTNRTARQDHDRKMLAATQKYLMQATAIPIAGKQYTPQGVITEIQQDMAIADAASKAKASLASAAAADEAQRATMTAFTAGLRAFVQNTFTDPSILAEFGFVPRKAVQPDTTTKAAAAAKRVAARKARGTLGSQQKKAITGNVTGIVITPVTQPAAAPAASAPATSAAASAPVTTAGH